MSAPLLALTAGGLLVDLGRCLREALAMLFETFWALVAGFALSGLVQSCVSREALRRHLGSHRPPAVARAAAYGMASSSCSYAAASMAGALVRRGADFVAAMVFMFASTNLVIELGAALAVLVGWRFVAAEFAGGAIMIVLLVAAGALVFTARVLDGVRGPNPEAHPGGSHRAPRRSRERLLDAGGYLVADLSMLRREIVLGFAAAGVLATLVPVPVWRAAFLEGHGSLTALENALAGPLVALVSCVCSVGNVPLAAALWHGGVSFGGVVAFLFADLVALPLLLVYRRLYGTRVAARMLAVFWAVMSLAGLLTGALFSLLHLVPPTRPATVTPHELGPGAVATVLDVVALGIVCAAYLASRARARGARDADPVCGMRVDLDGAPARADHDGIRYYFCSEHCRDRFLADPARFVARADRGHGPDRREVVRGRVG